MEDYNYTTEAIDKYYNGADQWKVISNNNITPEDVESVLGQIQGVDVVKSDSGKVLSYNFQANENVASSAVEAVNSNVEANIKSFDVPATTAVDTAGKMTFKSGMAQAGSFVLTEVVPAIAAAGAGITLGKTIDKVLYNANPNFWDEHGMSTLNPDEWNNITSNDTAAGRLFNMVFGLNPDNQTQAYIDQNALAYIALYMQNKGVFSEPSSSIVVPDNFPNKNTIEKYIVGGVGVTPGQIIFNNGTSLPAAPYSGAGTLGLAKIDNLPKHWSYIISSKNDDNHYLTKSYTYDGKTVNYTAGGVSYLYNISSVIPHTYNTDVAELSDTYKGLLAWLQEYGVVNKSSIDGIGTQDGAKTPDLSDATTVQETLDALKEQYPQLFDQAVTQDVVQPDGSTVTYTYVPIAMPELDPEGNPISSTATQASPQIDPATAPEPLLKLITTLIQKDPPINPPDTGNGDSPIVVIPTGSANALYSIYNPSQAQLNSFGAWLWSSNFVDQLLKLFNDPMQAIIGLHKVFATPPISGSGTIKVGYLDSGVSSNIVGNQYTTVDCGSVNLAEYFGNVFDYEPYTKVNLYLPFIGIVPLSVGEVMRSTIHVVYHVDVLTGACLAEVKVTRDAAGGTLFQYSGNAAVQYPISSGSYMGIISGIMSIAGGVAGTIATGGAAMPVLLGAGASVGRMHTDISHSGSFSGNAGAMGIKKPYLIIDRPQTALAKNFPNYIGYPSNTTVKLSSCHGFTKVKEIHLENVPATNNELSDIEMKLKGGVII